MPRLALSASLRHVQNWLLWHGLAVGRSNPDSSLPFFVTSLCKGLGVNCVIDVGAHLGEFATTLRRHGYRNRMVSFEPVPGVYEQLARHAASDPRWLVRNLALGAESGALPMHVHGTATTSSFRTASQYGTEQLSTMLEARDVILPIERLDAVFADCVKGIQNPRVYLKLDTQGWDLEVLQGATGCLDHVVALQSEMAVQPLYENAPFYTDAIPYIRNLGFEISTFSPVLRDPELRLVEFDCVMVRV